MTAARFEMYAVVPRGSGRPRPARTDPTEVTWRLLSGNNRDLGRAAGGFPDVATCMAALERLRILLPAATMAISSPDGRVRWTWRLRVELPEPVDVAVSSRGYQRRVQAEAAATVFLALAAAAPVTDSLRLVAL